MQGGGGEVRVRDVVEEREVTARACSSLHASLRLRRARELRFVSKVFRSARCAAAAAADVDADLVLHSLLNSNNNNCTVSVCVREREGDIEKEW